MTRRELEASIPAPFTTDYRSDSAVSMESSVEELKKYSPRRRLTRTGCKPRRLTRRLTIGVDNSFNWEEV